MSEATEFLVFCSALRETPERLRELGIREGDGDSEAILEEMANTEAMAVTNLEEILAGQEELTGGATSSKEGNPLRRFLGLRQRLLEALEGIDTTNLHKVGRLPSGRQLDPWRLAGSLADHDVQCLAKLRRCAGSTVRSAVSSP